MIAFWLLAHNHIWLRNFFGRWVALAILPASVCYFLRSSYKHNTRTQKVTCRFIPLLLWTLFGFDFCILWATWRDISACRCVLIAHRVEEERLMIEDAACWNFNPWRVGVVGWRQCSKVLLELPCLVRIVETIRQCIIRHARCRGAPFHIFCQDHFLP